MATLRYNKVGLSAISACVPKTVFSNRDLDYLMSKNAIDKLIGAIGVEEKRFADSKTCSSDLCYQAAVKLMKDNQIDPLSIDMLIFLSLTPDYITPPTSNILQKRLGLPNSTVCLDMSLACSGFVYALSTAYSFASGNGINRVLVLVGETMSKLINPRDKVNFPLYGDAGTACLVEKGDFEESTFVLTSDGDGSDFVKIPAGGFRNPINKNSLIDKEFEDGNFRRDTDITMDGMTTFNHAVTIIPKQIKHLISETNITFDDIDFLVSHQANKFMIDFIVKRLKFDSAKVPFCIAKYGNTSCASVPMTIVSELQDKMDGDKHLLLSAIGAGWSFGTAYIHTKNLKISDIVEY